MASDFGTMKRRTVLKASAGLLLGGSLMNALAPAAVAEVAPVGKAGDFDFLAGSWKIRHRRLKNAETKEWDEFDGEATCWTVLNGGGSIEELRIPARSFFGLGVRLLDVEKKVWQDFWVNARSGVLSPPGLSGVFQQGVGTFEADDVDGEQPIKVRGVWDRITDTSCRWHQAVSRDGGKSWEPSWFMDWKRA